MGATGGCHGVMWGDAILLLVGGAAGCIAPYFLRFQWIVDHSKYFMLCVFLMEAIYYQMADGGFSGSKMANTSGAITFLMTVVIAIADTFLPSNWSSNQGEGEGGNENPDQSPSETPKDAKGFLAALGNFRLFTLIFVLLVWCCLMMRGMSYGAAIGSSYHWWKDTKCLICPMFQDLFHYFTIIFTYGMYIMNDQPAPWLYFVCTIPMVVLPFISTIIAFYVHKPTKSMSDAKGIFNSLLSGALIYVGFKMFFMFQSTVSSQGMMDKLITCGVLAFGYLWMLFVCNINSMN